MAYCNWLSEQHGYRPVYTINGAAVTADWSANGYRLPTEAEWEYAARSRGKAYAYAWGEGAVKANVADETLLIAKGWRPVWDGHTDGYAYTAPAAAFTQGELGLSNMTGNVWEWCWDWYQPLYYGRGSGTDPTGPESGSERVLRGGSWINDPAALRVSNRYSAAADYRRPFVGFRVARRE